MLHQPILDKLRPGMHVIVAGAGGGYDVVCGLPVFVALERMGCVPHLASLTSTPLTAADGARRHTDLLYEVTADAERGASYFPEGWLSRWFRERQQREVPVWSLTAAGVMPLHESWTYLVQHLNADAIILADGGIDSLLRGDEHSLGTPLWDALNLAAVAYLEDVPVTILAATAFGAERWDGISHAQALYRLADLTAADALLGVATLLRTTPEGAAFLDCAEYILANQTDVRKSVVVAALLAALRGESGERAVSASTESTPIWISPLLSLYWFCDLSAVATTKQFLPRLLTTRTVTEAADRLEEFLSRHPRRPAEAIPI